MVSNQYQNIKYYNFPESLLEYDDLPLVKNKNNEDIIDVELFYKNFKDFIKISVDNCVQRILNEKIEGKLKNFTIMNRLEAKKYEEFFNSDTNTLTILI